MNIRPVFTSVVLLTGLMPVLPVSAGDPAPAGQHVTAAQAHKGEGTVQAIDLKEARIKIAHGPIASLGWGGMTMFFDVASPELLAGLKPGDKIAFTITRGKDGRFVISAITQD